MNLKDRIWRRAKRLHKLKIGPISIEFQLRRSVYVSNNYLRRINRFIANLLKINTCLVTNPSSRELDLSLNYSDPPEVETALIVGVGPGLGFSLAKRLSSVGCNVVLASRNAEQLDPLVAKLSTTNEFIRAFGCDATDEKSVTKLMSLVYTEFGVPDLVVYAVQGFCPGLVTEIEVPAFELCWRQNCLGGFIVSREAARMMLKAGKGSIILIGSTSSLIGRAEHLNLAVGKSGLRALSQVLARELWPHGIHVAHLVIDADINEQELVGESYPQADPEHIADQIYMLHRQPKNTWTSELDIRPWNEKFWEHC